MARDRVIDVLRTYIGQDLRRLAAEQNVTVFKAGKLNKGWAGHTLERLLGLALNSRQMPDGEDWELKVVPVVRKAGRMVPKETMAITMINPEDVARTPFEDSHLFAKLRHLVICGREFVDRQESRSPLISVGAFDLVAPEVVAQVRRDYDFVQQTIQRAGFDALTGKMGGLVQPRTKGAGHGSTSRAFYARTGFLSEILGFTSSTQHRLP